MVLCRLYTASIILSALVYLFTMLYICHLVDHTRSTDLTYFCPARLKTFYELIGVMDKRVNDRTFRAIAFYEWSHIKDYNFSIFVLSQPMRLVPIPAWQFSESPRFWMGVDGYNRTIPFQTWDGRPWDPAGANYSYFDDQTAYFRMSEKLFCGLLHGWKAPGTVNGPMTLIEDEEDCADNSTVIHGMICEIPHYTPEETALYSRYYKHTCSVDDPIQPPPRSLFKR